MPLVNAYCTVPELRDQFADASTNLSTALLERAINAASRAIDRYTGRRFWLDTGVAERTYYVANPRVAYVDDIGSRTGLVVRTGTDGVSFPTTLASGVDFILEPRNADKYASTGDPFAFWELRAIGAATFFCDPSRPTLSVTARHGWSAIPAEVTEATIIKAAALFKRKDAPFGVAGFGEFGAVRISSRMDPDVVELLDRYCTPGFA